MDSYLLLKIICFLIPLSILLFFHDGICVAAEQKPGTQTLKEEMRILWSKDEFLREWLVCGVFPSPPGDNNEHPQQGYSKDYLVEMGGEASARPVAGQTVKRPDGSSDTWMPYTSNSDIIDLIHAFPDQQNTNAVAYACTIINCAEAGKAILALGSDDSVKVWLNGKLAHTHAIRRGVRKDEDIVPVNLSEGENHLLIKVENGSGNWGFVVRILSEAYAMALGKDKIQPFMESTQDDESYLLIVNTDPVLGTLIPESVLVEAIAAGGKVVASRTVKRGERIGFDLINCSDGPYEVCVSKHTSEGYRMFVHLPWYKGDWLRQVRELLSIYEELPEKPDGASDLCYQLLGQLILDRLGDDLSAISNPDDWRKIHSILMEYSELRMGNQHGFVRLAWRDEIDDSPQFARTYLPPAYDPDKKWPMVVTFTVMMEGNQIIFTGEGLPTGTTKWQNDLT